MKNIHRFFTVTIAILLLLLSGCKNTGSGDAANWVGVYTAPHTVDGISSLIISAACATTIRVEIRSTSGGYIYTSSTLRQVSVTTSGQALIHESTHIVTGDDGLYDVQGSMSLSGGVVTLTATATNGQDVKNLTFNGQKQ